MVGTGAAAAQHWSVCEKMLHVQEQMRSPNKMVRGAESCLESSPISTRNAQKAQTNLVRTRDPTETETELSEHLLRRFGSAVACRRGGGSGCSRPGCGRGLLEEVAINPTIEPPELPQDWETDSWRAQTEPCVHQDPGERSSDPTGD